MPKRPVPVMIYRDLRRYALVLCALGRSHAANASVIKDMQNALFEGRYRDVVTIYRSDEEELAMRLYEYKMLFCATCYALRSYADLLSCSEEHVERMDGCFEKNGHILALGLMALACCDLGDY